MTTVVGFNWPAFHDNVAAAIVDGRLVFASEEERHSRHKHSVNEVPLNALQSLFRFLRRMGIKPADVDMYALNFNPKLFSWRTRRDLSYRALLKTANLSNNVPYGTIASALLGGMDYSRFAEVLLRSTIELCGERPPSHFNIVPVSHHLAHAASAYYFSGFESAAVITADGSGESDSTTIWRVKDGEFEEVLRLHMSYGSLGRMYEAMSNKLGLGRRERGENLEGPGKLMGLAPYGGPSEHYVTLRSWIQIDEEGGDIPFFFSDNNSPSRKEGLVEGLEVYNRMMQSVPTPSWNSREEVTKEAADLAWAVQEITEEAMLAAGKFAAKNCAEDKLALCGGVALNAKANMALYYSKMFNDIFIFPASNDAGSVIGAAAYVSERFAGTKMARERMNHVYLGPEYDQDKVGDLVRGSKWRTEYLGGDASTVAGLVANGLLVAWYNGRSELGPRALGNRSIVGNPTKKSTWTSMNALKGREWWRPLAPSLLESELPKYFLNGKPHQFMVMMYKLIEGQAGRVPAVSHVDGTARPQTIEGGENRSWFELVRAFKELTGEGIVVNTSFNLAGEPLVETPRDALKAFAVGAFDALYIEGWLIKKNS